MTTQAEILAQAADDEWTGRLLGKPHSGCFCGAREVPMKCLAYGYCSAHSTPVSAQMSADDKARLAKRIGL